MVKMRIPNNLSGLVIRLLLDSIQFSPLTITGYFTLRSLMKGGGLKGVHEKLTTKFLSTLVGAYRFWPFVHVIKFRFVPVELRVLYGNVASLFWTGYLRYIINHETKANRRNRHTKRP